MTAARTLALDVGSRRIGLAMSDPLGLTAQGLPTLTRTTPRDDVAAIQRLVQREGVGTVVVGMPIRTTGQRGPEAERVEVFAAALSAALDCPVRRWDERFSTAEGARLLRDHGLNARRSKAHLDRLAAQVILQGYLEANRTYRELERS
ncbi:MAG: Holliday junction resolvase RuvX [Candidatus Omnitrophica bacterium]|nr:Holliday junction resolvase RuvX [Candidatus Omnitrophota bacterium]